ncbi:MAG: peptidase S8, partial [Candidatus Sericytochromatia bacterium]|nr:peptidase S8 [Candidatus Tanganyikabacteria bacterium]
MSLNRVATFACVAAIAATLAGCGTALTAPAALQGTAPRAALGAKAVSGQLIVKYKAAPGVSALSRVLADNQALGYQIVAVPPGQTLEQAAAALAADPAVEWVDQNWILAAPDPFATDRKPPRKAAGIGFTTNDPVGKKQWHAPKINAEKAWGASRGEGVVVAVVDTGIDEDHPDLKANLLPGYNTLENNDRPHDDNGHGTHVAGIIASVAQNGVGTAGVAPGAKILPVRALGDMGGSAQSVASAIQWAADKGADVINLSLGSTQPSKAIESAVKYALRKGAAVVAAMGNAGDQGNPRCWPASYAGVIAVGALEPSDEPTSWSNWGEWQAVSAPGYGIWSTFPTYETSLYRIAKKNPGALPPENKIELGYSAISGTSQASPVVAGVAALLKSRDKRMTPAQVRDRLMKTA